MHIALRSPKGKRFVVDGEDVVPDIHAVLDKVCALHTVNSVLSSYLLQYADIMLLPSVSTNRPTKNENILSIRLSGQHRNTLVEFPFPLLPFCLMLYLTCSHYLFRFYYTGGSLLR